jgi:hypothetical protein
MSVTVALQEMVIWRQKFLTIEDAWNKFLDYLSARQGVDLDETSFWVDCVSIARTDIANGVLYNPNHEHWPRFHDFELRIDVLKALRTFLEN